MDAETFKQWVMILLLILFVVIPLMKAYYGLEKKIVNYFKETKLKNRKTIPGGKIGPTG